MTHVEQQSFNKIKWIVARGTLLIYPDFYERFDIHEDTSDFQVEAVINQNDKPIAFYSRELTQSKSRYTVTENELLSIVEILKEFRTILLGQRLKIYTNHKNLTCRNFNTDRVLR